MVKNRPKWWLPVAERMLGGIISVEGTGLNCELIKISKNEKSQNADVNKSLITNMANVAQ